MNTYRVSSSNALSQNSSGGKLLKWTLGDRWIKTSTFTDDLGIKFKYESYAEVIAYKVAKRIGIETVPYKLCEVIIDDSIRTIACESKDFRKDGEHYESIGKLIISKRLPMISYGEVGYRQLINLLGHVTGFESYMRQMLFLDSLILNDDRHYGNFGLIVGSQYVKPAPIFDNGNSLFCHKTTSGLKYSPNLIRHLRCKPFTYDFDDQLRIVKATNLALNTTELKIYIRKMLNNMTYNYELPKDRAIFIQDLLYSRLDYIGGGTG